MTCKLNSSKLKHQLTQTQTCAHANSGVSCKLAIVFFPNITLQCHVIKCLPLKAARKMWHRYSEFNDAPYGHVLCQHYMILMHCWH